MKVVSLAEIKARLSAFIDESAATGPVVITRNGRAAAVLVVPKDDEDLEDLMLSRSPKFQAILDSSRASIREGKALSRDVVMNDVWGTEYYGTQRSLDSFVASLRSKIEKHTGKPEHILTVHGVGYKFVR